MLCFGVQVFDLMLVCVENCLLDIKLQWVDDYVMIIVMVVNGYFGFYEKGMVIKGLDVIVDISSEVVFYVGIVVKDGVFVVIGGCVLNVIVCGVILVEVYVKVYVMVDIIDWLDGFNCIDIGWCVF